MQLEPLSRDPCKAPSAAARSSRSPAMSPLRSWCSVVKSLGRGLQRNVSKRNPPLAYISLLGKVGIVRAEPGMVDRSSSSSGSVLKHEANSSWPTQAKTEQKMALNQRCSRLKFGMSHFLKRLPSE